MASDRTSLAWIVAAALSCAACAGGERLFPLRDPVWRDRDLESARAACRPAPKPDDPGHVSCAPEPYDAPIYWDGADQMFFRPLSETLGLVRGGEAIDVNALDEVPDSSWFTNRLGVRSVGLDEVRVNACSEEQLLDPDHTPDGAWLIDQGKTSGSTPGFRVRIPGKGKYMVKVEATGLPERQVAATVIGEAVYWATGYNATCEQALLVRPSIFKLAPGLRARKGNFGDEYDFDAKALDELFARAHKHGDLLRISASAWLPGTVIEQFQYEGTRKDDPNDVVPHEDRRELRAARLIAAWIDHFDCRQGNSIDAWIPDDKSGAPDASPGHVVHYQSGTSAALGSVWGSAPATAAGGDNEDWNPLSRRLGYSYVFDWGDTAADFFTLGVPTRIWETVRKTPGRETFGYFDVEHFDAEGWKNEYPNPAFDRMTERDAAWMARILARYTRPMVRALVEMARFEDPGNTDYLERVLDGRLDKILERYLTRLSPVGDAHLEGRERLCATDVAEQRRLRAASAFRYTARVVGAGWLTVDRRPHGEICVTLPRVAGDDGPPAASRERYVRVRVEDGVARGPMVAHLYDLGPTRGYFLAGVERPE